MGLLRRRATALAAGVTLVASAKASASPRESSPPVRSNSEAVEGGAQVVAGISFPAPWLNWFEQAMQPDRTVLRSNQRFTAAMFMSFSDESPAGASKGGYWGLRGGSVGEGHPVEDEQLELAEPSWMSLRRAGARPSPVGLEGRERGAVSLPSDEGAESTPWEDGISSGDMPSGDLSSWTSQTRSIWDYEAIEAEEQSFAVREASHRDESFGGDESAGSSMNEAEREYLADELMRLQGAGTKAQGRRRMESYTGGYQVKVTAEVKAPSTSWNGAKYTLRVASTTIPGQEGQDAHSIGTGQVNEGGSSSEKVFNLERGCYVIWTSVGTRPYDVAWKVTVDEVDVVGASGGGNDWHTFGVGGALCGLGTFSTCYNACYTELEMETQAAANEDFQSECANYGDLLAPLTETFGANCDCHDDEKLQMRLNCLNQGKCDASQQCYIVNAASEEVTRTDVIRIVVYMTFTSSFDLVAIEDAVATWLGLNAAYVSVEYISGRKPPEETVTLRRRLRTLAESRIVEIGVEDEGHGDRRLQDGTFKRMEFKILAFDDGDVEYVKRVVDEGVAGLNEALGAQDEETGLNTAAAYAAEYTVSPAEYVAAADMPTETIAGSAGGASSTDVLAGEEEEEDDDTHFTRSAQFIFGALLVVVVAVALSIVACVVCWMKRKQQREFERKNEPANGEPRPVEVFDPWASVDRKFQKPTTNGSSTTYSATPPVMMNGSRVVMPNSNEGSS